MVLSIKIKIYCNGNRAFMKIKFQKLLTNCKQIKFHVAKETTTIYLSTTNCRFLNISNQFSALLHRCDCAHSAKHTSLYWRHYRPLKPAKILHCVKFIQDSDVNSTATTKQYQSAKVLLGVAHNNMAAQNISAPTSKYISNLKTKKLRKILLQQLCSCFCHVGS